MHFQTLLCKIKKSIKEVTIIIVTHVGVNFTYKCKFHL